MAGDVATDKAERRSLEFATVADLRREIDRLVAADNAGTLRTTGNWSAGQVFQHVGDLIRYSYDGFPFKAPLLIRVVGRLLKSRALSRPLPSGLRLRGASRVLIPGDGVATERGAAALRSQLDRIDAGKRMTQRSPIFGGLSHDQWLRLHLRHGALHFGFLTADGD